MVSTKPVSRKHPEIEPLYMKGLNDSQIDRQLGLSQGTTTRWRRENDLPSNWYHETERSKYAVYLRKTDELVCIGTAPECAEVLHYTSPLSFYRVYYRYKANGTGKYAICKIEEGDDDV